MEIAIISTYAPDKCGIGMYTQYLKQAILSLEPETKIHIVRMINSPEESSSDVFCNILKNNDASYLAAAEQIKRNPQITQIWIQHEYGLYGDSMEGLIALLYAVQLPIITTFHTLLVAPNQHQEEKLRAVLRLSSGAIVHSGHSQKLLKNKYGYEENVLCVPFGVSDTQPIHNDTNLYHSLWGVDPNANILLSYGLFHYQKGLEFMLAAMPAIISHKPNTVLALLGIGHPSDTTPNTRRYLKNLQNIIIDLGIEKNVIMPNTFLTREILGVLTTQAKIGVTLYLNAEQSTSGVLSEMIAAGLPVLATPYTHALEVMHAGCGTLVPFRSHRQIAKAVINMLDPIKYQEMQHACKLVSKDWNYTAHATKILSFSRTELSTTPRKRHRSTTLSNLSRRTSVSVWKKILSEKTVRNYPEGWAGWNNVKLAHIELLEELLKQEFTPPTYARNRGIIIGAGGAKYFGCGFACAYTLRSLGCTLPIEFWYLGEHEMDKDMKRLCDQNDISYVDAKVFCSDNHIQPRCLNGWELKPFATLHSQFKEVLYLDADCIPVKDPTYLFDDFRYRASGSIFWPDIPPGDRKEWLPSTAWNNIGMEYEHSVDFESGQYLINKQKCYKELCTTVWMNDHSDWFYKFVFGDKSTFHLAWSKCDSAYCMTTTPAGWRSPCILQYDLDNSLVFEHACRGKESLFSGDSLDSMLSSKYIYEAKHARDLVWDGHIFSWGSMSSKELTLARSLIGTYSYDRIGLGKRDLELMDGGKIGKGKDLCEKRWSLNIIDNKPTIIIIGTAHKESEIAMCLLKRHPVHTTKFIGEWTAFEKCKVVLRLKKAAPTKRNVSRKQAVK